MGSSDLGALRDLPEEKGSLEPNPLEVFEDQVPRLDDMAHGYPGWFQLALGQDKYAFLANHLTDF